MAADVYPKELYQSKFYGVWNNMHSRCRNPKNSRYNFYRHIKICDKWAKFSGFYEDMYPSYKQGLSLDRIDNHGDYCKENCRWATATEQARNTRNVERAKRFEFRGETKTIREWSEEYGINRKTLTARLIKYGWTIERALVR